MQKQSDEIMLASGNLGKKRFSFWLKISLFTFIVWSARYLTLNSLASCFIDLNLHDHITIFCRHLIMWVTMLISPTPGSSGTAEYVFNDIYGPMFGEYTMVISLIWRLFTYYAYLIIGIIVLPRWVKKFINK